MYLYTKWHEYLNFLLIRIQLKYAKIFLRDKGYTVLIQTFYNIFAYKYQINVSNRLLIFNYRLKFQNLKKDIV